MLSRRASLRALTRSAAIQGLGYVLTFTLPAPAARPLFELSLHLQWPKGTVMPRVKLRLPHVTAALSDAAGPKP